eukprot:14643-Heterococcus_DN1.PRE.2
MKEVSRQQNAAIGIQCVVPGQKLLAAACHSAAPLARSLRTYTPVGTLVAFLIIAISEVVLHTSVAVVSALDIFALLATTVTSTAAAAIVPSVPNVVHA